MYPHPHKQRDPSTHRTHLVPNGTVTSTGIPNKQSSQHKEEEKQQQKTSRKVKKSVFLWSNAEVMRWLRKKQAPYYAQYHHVFKEHDISGKSLVRLNHIKLEKMGITDIGHRADLLEHILRLKLKHELHELKLLQKVETDIQH